MRQVGYNGKILDNILMEEEERGDEEGENKKGTPYYKCSFNQK